MNRAERRRQLREQGYRRAPGKKGRRPAVRPRRAVASFDALERAGFVIARPKLEVPGG